MKNAGKGFPVERDDMILKIDSPKESLSGPHAVVFKDIEERWAIVACDWEDEPSLGIRWFWGPGGSPCSHGHATWFTIPASLSESVLSGLPIDKGFRGRLEDYLCGRIKGARLKKAKY